MLALSAGLSVVVRAQQPANPASPSNPAATATITTPVMPDTAVDKETADLTPDTDTVQDETTVDQPDAVEADKEEAKESATNTVNGHADAPDTADHQFEGQE